MNTLDVPLQLTLERELFGRIAGPANADFVRASLHMRA